MLFKLDIGRKLAGSSEFRLGFLRRGVTNENRYLLGKVPHVKEILANLAMISAKAESHCLISELGTKSNGDDLAGIEARTFVENFAIVLIIRRTRGAKGCGIRGDCSLK